MSLFSGLPKLTIDDTFYVGKICILTTLHYLCDSDPSIFLTIF